MTIIHHHKTVIPAERGVRAEWGFSRTSINYETDRERKRWIIVPRRRAKDAVLEQRSWAEELVIALRELGEDAPPLVEAYEASAVVPPPPPSADILVELRHGNCSSAIVEPAGGSGAV